VARRIVRVRLQDNDFIVSMIGPCELANGKTETIGHLIQILCSRAVPDLLRSDDRNFACATCQVYCYCSACRRCQFVLDVTGFHRELVGSQNLGNGRSWVWIGSARKTRYPRSDCNRATPPLVSRQFEFVDEIRDSENVDESISGPELVKFYVLSRVAVHSDFGQT